MKRKTSTNNFNNDSDDKYYSNNDFGASFTGGSDDSGFKEGLIHSKFNYDLFSEERALVVEKTIRCKRSVNAGKERWRLIEDDRVSLTVEGSRLSKKEKEFLRTIDGFNFLIQLFKKSGIQPVSHLKKELAKKLKK